MDTLHHGVTEKVWFITGTSRGFGREWAIAALERGDQVAATARDTAPLADLVERFGDAVLPLQLDVTDRATDFAAVKQAHEHFGRLDVVVNNAGYGQFGFVEELSEQDARDQIETNMFGAHVTLIEPAGFSTDWSGSSSRTAEPLPDYADLHAENEPSWRRADLLPLRVLAPHAGPGYRRQHGLVVAE
jgi:NAD(P)-dependent dehydrogenase (short-subunit alcohol dehydrogenase family)